MPNDRQRTTGIVVSTKIHPIGYALVRLFGKAVMRVDGTEYAIPWSESFLPVTPGRHEVNAFFYIVGGPITRAEASATVTIRPSGNVRIRYSTPMWFWENNGRLKIVG